MPLGMEVGLDRGTLLGPALPKRGTSPLFGRYLLWPNGRPSQLLLSTCFYISMVITTAVCECTVMPYIVMYVEHLLFLVTE